MNHSTLYIIKVCLIGAFILIFQTLYAQKNPQAVANAIAREFTLTIQKEMGNLMARYRAQSQEALSSSQKTIYCISVDRGKSEIYFKSEGACQSACRDLERIIKNATIQLIRRTENEVGHKISLDVNASFNKLIQGRITSKAVNNPNYKANSFSGLKSSSTSYMTHREEKLGIYANSQDRNSNQNRSNSQSADQLKGGRPAGYFDYSDHSAEQPGGLIDGISSGKQKSSNQPQIEQKLSTLEKLCEDVTSGEPVRTPVLAASQRTIGTSTKRLVDNTGEDRLGQTLLDGSTNNENQYQRNEYKLEQLHSTYDQLSKDKNSQKYYEQEDKRTNLQIQMIDPALKNAIVRSQKERASNKMTGENIESFGSGGNSIAAISNEKVKDSNEKQNTNNSKTKKTPIISQYEGFRLTGNEVPVIVENPSSEDLIPVLCEPMITIKSEKKDTFTYLEERFSLETDYLETVSRINRIRKYRNTLLGMDDITLKRELAQTQSFLEMAILARDVYEDTQPDQQSGNYSPVEDQYLKSLIERANDNESGFKCQLYVKDGKYALAIAGTEPGNINWEKLKNNIPRSFFLKILLGKLTGIDLVSLNEYLGAFPDFKEDLYGAIMHSNQVQQAHELVEKLMSSGEINASNLIFTGHSLGGRLATEIGLAYGVETYTFNAAGVSLMTRLEIGFINQEKKTNQEKIYNIHNPKEFIEMSRAPARLFGADIFVGTVGKDLFIDEAKFGHRIDLLVNALTHRELYIIAELDQNKEFKDEVQNELLEHLSYLQEINTQQLKNYNPLN